MWLDVTEIISYNVEHINVSDLTNSFFVLCRDNPSSGFHYDASSFSGQTYPATLENEMAAADLNNALSIRLLLGSHLAAHLRLVLDREKGFTAAVGVSTNKILSKLVGSVSKPNAQTTLLPPYNSIKALERSNVERFLDAHEIGRIPGVGFKISQSIKRAHLGRDATFSGGLVVGKPDEFVSVGEIRSSFTLGKLEQVLGSRVGRDIFDWIHGRDEADVQRRKFPTQISFEDTYLGMTTIAQVRNELLRLSRRLVSRMRVDLATEAPDTDSLQDQPAPSSASMRQLRFMAVPRTIRVSARSRLPLGERSFGRVSRSTALPLFVLSPDSVDAIAPRFVDECLLPLFKRMFEPTSEWNLNFLNVAVTHIAEEGVQSQDILAMLARSAALGHAGTANETLSVAPANDLSDKHSWPNQSTWTQNEDIWEDTSRDACAPYPSCVECEQCGALFPAWALVAHERYHNEKSGGEVLQQRPERGG